MRDDRLQAQEPASIYEHDTVLYRDSLVTITATGLRFRHYYFPFGSKYVPFADIVRITVHTPSIENGKWRQWGSGSLLSEIKTWFPCDWLRHRRSLIFMITRQSAPSWRIGFTVKDSQAVQELLRARGLLDHDSDVEGAENHPSTAPGTAANEEPPEVLNEKYERRAPGWVIRCLTCGFTEAWGKHGIRIRGYGREWKLGWCARCRRIRCMVVEKRRKGRP